MTNNRARFLTLALVLAMLTALLTACGGGGGGGDSIVGTWKADKMEVAGVSMAFSDFAKTAGVNIEFTFEFKNDGKVTGNMMGTAVDGTYKVDGKSVEITIMGDAQTLTLNGGEMSFESPQGKFTLKKQ